MSISLSLSETNRRLLNSTWHHVLYFCHFSVRLLSPCPNIDIKTPIVPARKVAVKIDMIPTRQAPI